MYLSTAINLVSKENISQRESWRAMDMISPNEISLTVALNRLIFWDHKDVTIQKKVN